MCHWDICDDTGQKIYFEPVLNLDAIFAQIDAQNHVVGTHICQVLTLYHNVETFLNYIYIGIGWGDDVAGAGVNFFDEGDLLGAADVVAGSVAVTICV